MTRITKATAVLALGAAIAFVAAGCTAFSPIATEQSYNASDGVTIESGAVILNNALFISDDGELARFVGRFTNKSSEAQTVNIQIGSGTTATSAQVSVKAQSSYDLTDSAIVSNLGALPGATVPVYIQAGTATGQQVETPVLNGDLPAYASLVPTPSAEPSASDAVDASKSPKASAPAQ